MTERGAATLALERSAVYGFLARVALTPRSAGGEGERPAWRALGALLPEADGPRLAEAIVAAAATGGDPAEAFTDAMGDGAASLRPVESVHRGASADHRGVWRPGRLRGPWWWEVRAAYGRERFDPGPVEADHLAAELAFLASLAATEATGDPHRAAACRAETARFLGAHPGAWVPALAARAEAEGVSPYYAGALALTAAWLSLEARWLAHASAA